jgi:hypothetical protein
MRTAVGVVWDLIAFWPRLAHPICPPPYGGRAVLAMTGRTQLLLGQGKKIVLSGHSQGSVVCAAVVRLLHETELSAAKTLYHVHLVTYGTQLQWAFARMFPAYMGHDEMKEMYEHELATRWRSMYRRTDPLGGPVLDTFQASHDIRLLDPVSIGGDLNATVRPELRGHSGYYLDPRFHEVVRDVRS